MIQTGWNAEHYLHSIQDFRVVNGHRRWGIRDLRASALQGAQVPMACVCVTIAEGVDA